MRQNDGRGVADSLMAVHQSGSGSVSVVARMRCISNECSSCGGHTASRPAAYRIATFLLSPMSGRRPVAAATAIFTMLTVLPGPSQNWAS